MNKFFPLKLNILLAIFMAVPMISCGGGAEPGVSDAVVDLDSYTSGLDTPNPHYDFVAPEPDDDVLLEPDNDVLLEIDITTDVDEPLDPCKIDQFNYIGPSEGSPGTWRMDNADDSIKYTTAKGWIISIFKTKVMIEPPFGSTWGLRYEASGGQEWLGPELMKTWSGNTRSIIVFTGAKVTMKLAQDEIEQVVIFDGFERHVVEPKTLTIVERETNPATAREQDDQEPDGETAFLKGYFKATNLTLIEIYREEAPLKKTPIILPLGHQDDSQQAFSYGLNDWYHHSEENGSCADSQEPKGGLLFREDGVLQYKTRSGLWNILVNLDKVTVTRIVNGVGYSTWEIWGYHPHENLNGKHIKDWLRNRRTLLLDDGTKITLHTDGPNKTIHTTSIYDGPEVHQLDNQSNGIRFSCVDSTTAVARERLEADGETAYLVRLKHPDVEFGTLFVFNAYDQSLGQDDTADIEAPLDFAPFELGETGDDFDPKKVNDLYDDPCLAFT